MAQNYRILIVHNRYQIPGGEDTVVANEINMLRQHGHEVFYYERNNSEMKEYNFLQKCALPFSSIYSFRTKQEIRQIIQKNRIDLVHVHNTFLMVSPSVYDAAGECNVPVVQTVHNFRFVCPNGLFFRDGRVCEECLHNGLQCAVKHSCYRGSKAQTAIVAMTLKRMRLSGVFKRIYLICLTAFNRQKLLDIEITTRHADLIERADLLRGILPNRLVLIADYVGRFDAEAYCGAGGLAQKIVVLWRFAPFMCQKRFARHWRSSRTRHLAQRRAALNIRPSCDQRCP